MPTPTQLAKSGSEHSEQVAVFAWCAVACYRGLRAANDELAYTTPGICESYGTHNAIPALKWIHAIPNGGSRGDDEKTRAIRGGQLKAEGVRSGVADILWPYRRKEFAGLYIEMKKEKGGTTSPEQKEFGEFVKSQGYVWVVCHGWKEAVKVIQEYLQF